MRASVSKLLKSGKMKTIGGTVLQRGQGIITLIVTDNKGMRHIKRFREESYTVRVFE